MADDLISRRAVKDAFHAYMVRRFDKDRCADAKNCEVCERKCLWHEVVASVPASDAVEVVRCKDCKHCVLTTDGEYNPYDVVCDWWATDGLKATDFCSYGEKRGENND